MKNFSSKKGLAKARYVRPMAMSNHHVMRADKKLSADEAQAFMQEVMATGNVEYIEIDQMLQPFATPNDPRYSDQWHYYEQAGGLNLPTAWDSATGSGVTVAVLDTGYRPHVDLNANILPGYDMISNLSVANDGGGRDSDARDPAMQLYVVSGYRSKWRSFTKGRSRLSWHGTMLRGPLLR